MTASVMTREPDEFLLGFATALRAAGVPVTQDRTRTYLDAVALVGLGDREATRNAGRATLCGTREDLERHDRVFDEWFHRDNTEPTLRPRGVQQRPGVSLLPDDPPDLRAKHVLERGAVVRLAALGGVQERPQRGRADEAAGVRGQDSAHEVSSSVGCGLAMVAGAG